MKRRSSLASVALVAMMTFTACSSADTSADGANAAATRTVVDAAGSGSSAELDELIETAVGNPDLGLHGGHQEIESVLDEVLGISHDELHERMDAGQNLAAVATELGIDPQTLIDALVAEFRGAIDEAEGAGVITSDEATEYLTQLEKAFTNRVMYEA
jgi:hypothetical protein